MHPTSRRFTWLLQDRMHALALLMPGISDSPSKVGHKSLVIRTCRCRGSQALLDRPSSLQKGRPLYPPWPKVNFDPD
jgi:hypothetical protein